MKSKYFPALVSLLLSLSTPVFSAPAYNVIDTGQRYAWATPNNNNQWLLTRTDSQYTYAKVYDANNGQVTDMPWSPAGYGISSFNDQGEAFMQQGFSSYLGSAQGISALPGGSRVMAHDGRVYGYDSNTGETFVTYQGVTSTLFVNNGNNNFFATDGNINNQAVGYGSLNGRNGMYLLENGQLTEIAALPGFSEVESLDINDAGQVFGTSKRGWDKEYFIYQGGASADIGSGYWGAVSGFNNLGQVIVNHEFSSGDVRTALYDNGTYYDLASLTNGYFDKISIASLSDSGDILLYGKKNGQLLPSMYLLDYQAVTSNPVSEPPQFVLFLMASLFLLFKARQGQIGQASIIGGTSKSMGGRLARWRSHII